MEKLEQTAMSDNTEQNTEHEFQLWLEYGKEVMALSFLGAQKKVDDVSKFVFEEIRKKYKIIKIVELGER